MKKLFTLLTAILLTASMATQAQLLSAINDTPEGGTLPQEANLISGRNNAPMATYETSFTWNELYSITNPQSGSNWTRCNMVWFRNGNSNSRPALRLVFVVKNADHLTINNMYAPQYGTYTFSDDQPTFNTCYNAWTDYESLFYPNSEKTYYLVSGTVTVSEGQGGKPYIVVETTENANTYGNIVTGGDYITSKFTIGSPKQYSITVNKSPSAGGTVTGGGTLNAGATTTIVATPDYANGYAFVKWQKDNADFEGNTATSITLTVSAETEGTYTAVFHTAATGTITANASPAACGSVIVDQPSTAGATAVTLTPVANSGYIFTGWDDDDDGVIDNTDNPRIVYVDGDKDYTALFAECVEIYVANGIYDLEGNYFDISGSANNYQVQFESFKVYPLRTGDYTSSDIYKGDTYVQYNGEDKITFDNRQATISRIGVMTWRLDALFSNSTGPVYHVVIDVQKPLDGDISSNISHTFTDDINVYVDDNDDNIWWITTDWETSGWEGWWSDFAVYIDKAKQCGASGIPSGVYTVAYPASVGNVVPTYAYSVKSNSSNATYDGTICGYYNNGYYNWFFPVSGTVEIVNNNGSYYFQASLTNSNGYTVSESYGSRPSSYTITVASNNNEYGTVQFSTCGTGAVAGQTNKYYVNTTMMLTAEPLSGYVFDHWEVNGVEVEGEDETYNYTVSSSDAAIVAVFKRDAVSYTVTFNDYNGTQLQSSNVEENTQPTIASDPTRADDVANNTAYTFVGWKSSADDNVYATANLPVATAAVSYTAQYEPYFLLLDDKTDNNDAYYTALANKEGERLNVKYMRTFTAGRWATFSLPFGYSYRPEENTTFKGQVYYLISAKYTADGYLTLNCMPVTDGLVANKPYILIPSATIENPTFKNVKMKAVAPNYYTAPNTEGIGTGVEFRNTIERETLEKDKRVIYIKGANNQLYYPSMSVDTWMRPFRGYFYLNVTPEQIQYTPARVRLVTPEGEYIEQVPDTEEAATVETKKYIENGILIIERAGMKYDAQGHIIK